MCKIASLSIAATIAFATVGLARADEEAPLSRAQVLAELAAARSSGELGALIAEDSGSFWLSRQPVLSTLTRRQVSAEAMQARERGEALALVGEDSGSVFLSARLGSRDPFYAGPDIGTEREAADPQPAS